MQGKVLRAEESNDNQDKGHYNSSVVKRVDFGNMTLG